MHSSTSLAKRDAAGVTRCQARLQCDTTCAAYGRSSVRLSSETAVTAAKRGPPALRTAAEASAATVEESRPPDRHVPTGTSLRRCSCTDSVSAVANSAADAGGPLASNASQLPT